MHTTVLATAILLLAQAAPVRIDEATAWKGVRVMPKLGAVVKVGNKVIDGPEHSTFDLPLVVQDAKDGWLWVGRQRKGWVKRDQILTLDEAAAYYTKLIDTRQHAAWAYNRRGLTWTELGELQLAITDFGQAIRLDSTNSAALTNRGTAWRRKQEYEKAIADYDRAIQLNPDNSLALTCRAVVWEATEEFDSMIDDCTQAIGLDPSNSMAHTIRGNGWWHKNYFDKALADYKQAIFLDPANAGAYNNRAILWNGKRAFDKAIADYDTAIRLDPTYVDAFHNRGFAKLKRREFDKAIDDYSEAIRLDPGCISAYFSRGLCWQYKKDYDRAIADYEEVIRLDQHNSAAFANAAWIWATCADPRFRNGSKAVEFATKACELQNWSGANDLAVLAAGYAEAGDFGSAIKWQEKAIDVNSSDAKFVVRASDMLALYKDHKPYREE